MEMPRRMRLIHFASREGPLREIGQPRQCDHIPPGQNRDVVGEPDQKFDLDAGSWHNDQHHRQLIRAEPRR